MVLDGQVTRPVSELDELEVVGHDVITFVAVIVVATVFVMVLRLMLVTVRETVVGCTTVVG